MSTIFMIIMKEKLSDAFIANNYGSLYDGTKKSSFLMLMNSCFFIYRRLIFASIMVFFDKTSGLQIIL